MTFIPNKDHIAIITGSAQGFGKEFAKRLLIAGARVCISDINEEIGKNTTKEFRDTFGQDKVTFHSCNVTKQEDWELLWNHAEEYFSNQVTLLVNNAGVNPTFGYKTCIDINLLGLSLGVFLAMEKMSTSKGKKGGRIINIASMAGLLEGMQDLDGSGYSVSKFGVVALTRSFAQMSKDGAWITHGVKAMALCPWFANTQLLTTRISANDLDEQIKSTTGKANPLEMRILEVPEVGDKFMECLRLDKSGACYIVFPSCPLIDFPNVNYFWVFAMITFGQLIARPLSIRSFGMPLVLISGLIIFLFLAILLTLLF